MRRRLVTAAIVVAALAPVPIAVAPAWASDLGGQNNYANAQASGGQLTVQAGHTYWTPPAGSSWATAGRSDPPPSTTGTTNPDQPYGCTYTAQPSATATIGVGGAQPGEWVFPECSGPGAVDPMPPMWVTNAQPGAVTVAVDPVVVGEQAVQQLGLGSPSIEMAPPSGSPQLVGVATWLWIDPVAWQDKTATASAGTVTATATAAPSKVVWDMGDGDSVTCDGPGTPYSASDPNATTDCSYTWPQVGSYTVTATVYWSVSWTAVGAAGGGNLGLQAGPAAEVPVTVTESQAINTPTGGSN
ncbi:MAG TPA: hypothetical protein VHV57_09055 [Acidimicrobiales bacterium]|jgi:hypothetical protein|nr:hypothetical protein [Acidimicrobiales bacterium]